MRMRAWGGVLLFAVVAAFATPAQFGGPQGAPPGAPEGPGRGVPGPNFPSPTSSQRLSEEPTATIKTQTILVPVRVVVRDTNGRAVANLKKQDFKLYQDGKRVEIATFTSVAEASRSGADAAAVASATGPKEANATSVSAPSAAPARFIALFFDDYHMQFESMAQTRNAAAKYLATLHPEDRVAIVTASGEGELDFTGDTEKLQAAMMKLRSVQLPGGPPIVTALHSPCPPPMPYTEAYAIDHDKSEGVTDDAAPAYTCGNGSLDPRANLDAGKALASEIAARTQIAGEEAIDSIFERLERSVRRLSVLPGQRIVVLVSSGFIYGGHQEPFAGIIHLAIGNNVVVNALDALRVSIGGTGPLRGTVTGATRHEADTRDAPRS
jgi:VWFA-related protein